MNRIPFLRMHWCVLGVLVCLSATGCVRRRLTVRTNPPGALVFVDEQEIGTTPVSTGFTYYGTRTIRIEKDGFETVTVSQKFNPPWYEIPPLDFVSENFVPGENRDERVIDITLQPQQIVPPQVIRQRAEGLRNNAREGFVAPLPPSAATGAAPAAGLLPPPPTGSLPPPITPAFPAFNPLPTLPPN